MGFSKTEKISANSCDHLPTSKVPKDINQVRPRRNLKKKRAPMPRRKSARNRLKRQENSDGELTAENEQPLKGPMNERVESSGNVTAKRAGSAECMESASLRKKPTRLADVSGDEVTSTDSQSRPETAVRIEREVTGRVCVLNFYNLSDSERRRLEAAASENRVRSAVSPVLETTRVSITPDSTTPEDSITVRYGDPAAAELSDAELLRLKQAEEKNLKMKTVELKLRGLKLCLQSRASSSVPDPDPPGTHPFDEWEEQLELNELQKNMQLLSEFLAAFETIKSGPVAWLQRVMDEYISYKEKITDIVKE